MKLKEIAENHGLTLDGVDYALTQYQIVICEITHGMMSKLSYDAKDIIQMAQERWCDTCDLKDHESVKPIDETYWDYTYGRCGQCRAPLPALEGLHSKFCWMCGKAVKWND